MGSAAEVYRWVSIGPDERVGVFIHPYEKNEFVSFCIVVDLRANQPRGAYTQVAAQMTDGRTDDFFDRIARTIWVENKTVGPQPYISVGLIRFRQNI